MAYNPNNDEHLFRVTIGDYMSPYVTEVEAYHEQEAADKAADEIVSKGLAGLYLTPDDDEYDEVYDDEWVVLGNWGYKFQLLSIEDVDTVDDVNASAKRVKAGVGAGNKPNLFYSVDEGETEYYVTTNKGFYSIGATSEGHAKEQIEEMHPLEEIINIDEREMDRNGKVNAKLQGLKHSKRFFWDGEELGLPVCRYKKGEADSENEDGGTSPTDDNAVKEAINELNNIGYMLTADANDVDDSVAEIVIRSETLDKFDYALLAPTEYQLGKDEYDTAYASDLTATERERIDELVKEGLVEVKALKEIYDWQFVWTDDMYMKVAKIIVDKEAKEMRKYMDKLVAKKGWYYGNSGKTAPNANLQQVTASQLQSIVAKREAEVKAKYADRFANGLPKNPEWFDDKVLGWVADRYEVKAEAFKRKEADGYQVYVINEANEEKRIGAPYKKVQHAEEKVEELNKKMSTRAGDKTKANKNGEYADAVKRFIAYDSNSDEIGDFETLERAKSADGVYFVTSLDVDKGKTLFRHYNTEKVVWSRKKGVEAGIKTVMLTLDGMRKPQRFVNYGVIEKKDGRTTTIIQSDKAIGEFDLETGKGKLYRGNSPYFHALALGAKPYTLTAEQLEEVKKSLMQVGDKMTDENSPFSMTFGGTKTLSSKNSILKEVVASKRTNR